MQGRLKDEIRIPSDTVVLIVATLIFVFRASQTVDQSIQDAVELVFGVEKRMAGEVKP